MEFQLFSVWNGICKGFGIFIFDTYRQDTLSYSLLGVSYDTEDKILGIDFCWRYFEFKF